MKLEKYKELEYHTKAYEQCNRYGKLKETYNYRLFYNFLTYKTYYYNNYFYEFTMLNGVIINYYRYM